ncbi:hypothetical protein V9T40_001704 [Parthenolecanium corni]|uniref:Uncharacterized protein n=1 Tax=Parthenolecanium corni TaxID=536013 RepID=A0AAN9TW30_9HEMI
MQNLASKKYCKYNIVEADKLTVSNDVHPTEDELRVKNHDDQKWHGWTSLDRLSRRTSHKVTAVTPHHSSTTGFTSTYGFRKLLEYSRWHAARFDRFKYPPKSTPTK